ncbi:SAM-dependent methyltransferase [Pandoraea thiooxydans]|uniref:SAM-dependent methyltransferase n=1 Tax=Pandoraea thiooxydans TaxID=445709 RepID=A0A0G3ER37_9BURK|nr:class I SAM-dependent methyltransferase [Pandoraea thiooxydans]AKJ69400.1 SAM-dependent methyltransferase [Pandoraea thiooxydans]APR97042.1 SAM-dependent methyltransferase [Pandoraea thiooxydans]
MDEQTVETYSTRAERFAAEWRDQPPPTDMYAMLQRYFAAGGKTADIGCGSGRDVAWLNDHGYPAVGYDAAEGLIAQAAIDFPSLTFRHAALPALASIASESYDNVLCETVIMHLPPDEVTQACARLVDILRPAGTLYLSWRVAPTGSSRDAGGRLYAAFDAAQVRQGLGNAQLLFDAEAVNESSGKRVHRIVARRGD